MNEDKSFGILKRLHQAIVSCHNNGQEIESIELNTNAMLAFKEAIIPLLKYDRNAASYDDKNIFFLGIEIKEVMSNINGITVIYKE